MVARPYTLSLKCTRVHTNKMINALNINHVKCKVMYNIQVNNLLQSLKQCW